MNGTGCDLCRGLHDVTGPAQNCTCGCHGMLYPAPEPYPIAPTKVEVNYANKGIEDKLDEIILLLKELLKK